MMSLQTKLRKIQDALAAVTGACYHYRRPRTPDRAYIVWAEDGEDQSFSAGNRKAEQQIHGYADYFTTVEFDPVVDAIQEALADPELMAGWSLESVEHEDETNLIHYRWQWWTA